MVGTLLVGWNQHMGADIYGFRPLIPNDIALAEENGIIAQQNASIFESSSKVSNCLIRLQNLGGRAYNGLAGSFQGQTISQTTAIHLVILLFHEPTNSI